MNGSLILHYNESLGPRDYRRQLRVYDCTFEWDGPPGMPARFPLHKAGYDCRMDLDHCQLGIDKRESHPRQ